MNPETQNSILSEKGPDFGGNQDRVAEDHFAAVHINEYNFFIGMRKLCVDFSRESAAGFLRVIGYQFFLKITARVFLSSTVLDRMTIPPPA